MDPTLKLILDKITQLTNRFNSLTQNSKKIHELSTAQNDLEKYIAVSDGTNTQKVVYRPSEVSKYQFDKLAGLSLSINQNSSTISIKDADGLLISSEDLSFLNANNLTMNVDQASKTLQLKNAQSNILSSVQLSDLFDLKSKGIFVHVLTANEISSATITLQLQHNVLIEEDYFLYVNGQFINDDDYLIQNDKVVIAKSNIEFEIVAGMKVTFRYKY